jgi:hypothetical protein
MLAAWGNSISMKIAFLIAVALVIPLFFVLIFVQGTYSQLARLRARARSALASLEMSGDQSSPSSSAAALEHSGSAEKSSALNDYRMAADQYESIRKNFPARWVAKVFGFDELEQRKR